MNLKMWNKWKDFRLDEDLNEDDVQMYHQYKKNTNFYRGL